jgi:hypothetical protein
LARSTDSGLFCALFRLVHLNLVEVEKDATKHLGPLLAPVRKTQDTLVAGYTEQEFGTLVDFSVS